MDIRFTDTITLDTASLTLLCYGKISHLEISFLFSEYLLLMSDISIKWKPPPPLPSLES
jgi:hypothetical protein